MDDKDTEIVAEVMEEQLWIVRQWDMFDGWLDCTGPVTCTEADKIWNEYTGNGTHNTKYDDGDYYKIFPSNTEMIYTPEFLGR